jgi:molybdenum cofactor biosynthesis protein B
LSLHGHRAAAPRSIGCGILTASNTRTLDTDETGALIRSLLEEGGHTVRFHQVVPDEPSALRAAIAEAEADGDLRVLLINGGTGIAPRDRTYEAVVDLLERPLPGFGELFRMLSHREVGSAAMLSRAIAGVRGCRVLFSLPGSPAAARLALVELILPEVGHLVGQIDSP